MRTTIIHGLALVVIAVGALSACGDGDNDGNGRPEPDRTSTSLPSSTPPAPAGSPTPARGPSGIDAVDAAIEAVEQGDVEAFIDLILLAPEPCAAPAQGAGGPPQCAAGEATGTPVEVAPFASCEGYWSRADALRQTLTPLFDRPARLYAVYEATNERLFDREGDYAVIFELTGGPEGPLARDVVMTDEGVVGVNFGCGQNPEQMVEFHELTDAIVEPDETRTQ